LNYDQLPKDKQELRAKFIFEWENPIMCKICNSRFKGKQKLKEHKREVHAY